MTRPHDCGRSLCAQEAIPERCPHYDLILYVDREAATDTPELAGTWKEDPQSETRIRPTAVCPAPLW